MRIEKISDKQIRCTLTSDDLLNRHINIGELAYGSEKARSLFHEMLTQASREFNFQAENIPLMIEAVPVSGDSLVLLITKVEDPDELDTRFSRFSPSIDDEDFLQDYNGDDTAFGDIGADEIIAEFERLCAEQTQTQETDAEKSIASADVQPDFFRVYSFRSIDEICRASRALRGSYDADNSLYKDTDHSLFYLVLHKGGHSPQTFNKICNIMSEYAESIHSNAGTESYYKEHLKIILKGHALQSLEGL